MIRKTIVILLFLFLINGNVGAAWKKYDKNPIISTSSGGWDASHASAPSIIFDNRTYQLWYMGYGQNKWSIGLATSTDGKTWDKSTTNPVLLPSNETSYSETDIVEPSILKNDIYRMWFNSFDISKEDYKIRYATSTAGLSWQKYPTPVLVGEKNWEKKGVATPSVIYKDGKYFMWYSGWGYGSPWQIGQAESTDGINWVKYTNNPLALPSLGHIGGPDVTYENGKYYMFYHTGGGSATDIYYVTSSDGINWQCENSCSILKSQGTGYDSQAMLNPSLFIVNNEWYLAYAGSNGQHLQIGLAIREEPTVDKTPIVIIPGFMASWNRDAILHNSAINPGDWQLTPFVEEYKGIINTFKNLGYQEGRDFLVYPYDWRKNLDEDADNLNNFLQQKIWNDKPDAKIDLVGHSLGGLVARTWVQKYSSDKVDKLITVGSPHKGTAQVYKPIEAGEIDKSNDWLWLATKSILMLNKDSIETDKETANDRLPVLADMLPTEPFLKQNGSNISIDSMQIKNNYLITANNNITPILPKLSMVVGQKSNNTLAGYDIGTRTVLDQLLDLYPDGRPIGSFGDTGDYLILAVSAGIGNNIKTFSTFDHGELIFKKDAIKEILTELNIPVTDNQIVESSPTIISPSLIFMIKSPATMEVVYNGNSYQEHDGIIFIPGAQNGDYTLNIHGKENGHYTVLAGQIIANGDFWNTIDGDIIQTPPSNQTDTYHINFDSNLSQPPLSPESAFDEIINNLTDLRQNYNNTQITSAINSLKQGKILFRSNQISALKSFLLLAHSYLLTAKNRTTEDGTKNKLSAILSKSENLYQTVLTGSNQTINTAYLQNKMQGDNDIFSDLTVNLLLQKNQGQNTAGKNGLLAETQNRLTAAQNFYSRQNYLATEITLDTGENLIDNLRKP